MHSHFDANTCALAKFCVGNTRTLSNSLYFCLHSLMKDVSMRKGSLVCAYAAPRRAAKKFVYVIGGSHRELGSAWTKEEYTYDSVERYDIYAKQWRQVRFLFCFVFSSQPLLAEQPKL